MQIGRAGSIAVKIAAILFWTLAGILLMLVLMPLTAAGMVLPVLAVGLGIAGWLPKTRLRSDILTQPRQHYVTWVKWISISTVGLVASLMIIAWAGASRSGSTESADPEVVQKNREIQAKLMRKREFFTPLGISAKEIADTLQLQRPLKEEGDKDKYLKTRDLTGETADHRISATFRGPAENVVVIFINAAFSTDDRAASATLQRVALAIEQATTTEAASWAANCVLKFSDSPNSEPADQEQAFRSSTPPDSDNRKLFFTIGVRNSITRSDEYPLSTLVTISAKRYYPDEVPHP